MADRNPFGIRYSKDRKPRDHRVLDGIRYYLLVERGAGNWVHMSSGPSVARLITSATSIPGKYKILRYADDVVVREGKHGP